MSQYQSKTVDASGFVAWTENEDKIWHELVSRQQDLVKVRGCQAYLEGLSLLELPLHRVPQLPELNKVLLETTGWQVVPVPALIDFDHFFELLSQRCFPVATFLRRREEFDYLQEPDYFHEVFGHCAMLTNPKFADYTHAYGQLGKAANKQQRAYLARLYWFTVEFGLVREDEGLKIYGGGILSSPGETRYALDSVEARRTAFNLEDVLRTPYRIDIMQPIYYVLEDIDHLYQLTQRDIMADVTLAMNKGLLPPLYT